ncbi:GNAT family N-acetyltransferase [Pseudomonas moraviensis]|jgi:ribosomal protein S18 acetylase RimI-like enzyme|uniref:GNAT family N-acetyltransferase n=1 Tax=Pseudomonas moraviensis TaxID=321662 RepID=A0A423NQC7_9PSED|nr:MULTISPECIES: GNAT family N-acetyltransferase [Pseudomonas]QXI20101.1 GNAT family N-acetyltransferase [Pseudomonas iranensis]ROO00458.1 GNAT family N-acetyltransferase [Pseudomonas moraviensis]
MTFNLQDYVPSVLDLADTALRPLDSRHDLKIAFPVIQQLRPHLTSEADFMSRIERMRAGGYRLVGAFESSALVALAGYRLQENLIYGPFLYVDDLITDEAQRGGQWGSRLLRALERLARASGCARLVLDTGLANARAQRFYFREGLYTGALRFQKQFDTP